MTIGAIKGFRTEEISDDEMLRARAAYFANVDLLDEVLGDFLAVLDRDGLLDNTIVIYTTDHGELAGEHGIWWKNTWHEGATRVPFIVSLPEQRRGELPAHEVTTPVSLADLFPTICGLAGVPTPEGLVGVDLSSVIRGGRSSALERRTGVITESLAPRWGAGTEFRMIRTERYKYIAFRGCDDLAFDLQEDPDEQHNLVGRARGEVKAELERLRMAVLEDFDFDYAEQRRQQEVAELRERYATRMRFETPNQILLGDGRLVEADAPLYCPHVVSENPAQDMDDFPE